MSGSKMKKHKNSARQSRATSSLTAAFHPRIPPFPLVPLPRRSVWQSQRRAPSDRTESAMPNHIKETETSSLKLKKQTQFTHPPGAPGLTRSRPTPPPQPGGKVKKQTQFQPSKILPICNCIIFNKDNS